MSPHYLVNAKLFHLTEGNVVLHHALRNLAHLASRRFQNSSISWIGIRYMRCCESYPHSALRSTKLTFIQHGAKINRQYYRDVLLMQKQLPAIRSIAGDVFVFQQDNVPAHVLVTESSFCAVRQSWHVASQQSWPQPGRLPRLGHAARARVHCIDYQSAIRTSCGRVLLRHGLNFSTAWWTMEFHQWWKKLEACIRTEDGQFQHLLWCCLPDIPVCTFHNRFFSEPPMVGGMQH